MKNRVYWFPVRPARNGWGWGLPIRWQGWVAYLVFFGGMLAGIWRAASYGQWAVIAFACVWGPLFVGLMFWKGEPQSMRDNGSP
jgi:hypothetical protein